MPSFEDTAIKPHRIELEDSPLLKVRRRSKGSSLVPDADHTRHLTANRKNAPRPSDIHSEPPPPLQPLRRAGEVTQLRSLSLTFQEAVKSLPHPRAEVFNDDFRLARQDLEHADLRELVTVEDSDGESDEEASSTNEDQSVHPPEPILRLEGGQQQQDGDPSDNGDLAQKDSLNDIVVPEDDAKATPQESKRLRFRRYRPKDKDLCSINESIVEIMKNERKPRISPGWTYIFESPVRAGHLKIGSTIRMYERGKSLKRCERELILVKDNDRDAFDFHSIVESLVHQELHNKRKILSCHCGGNHQEWFEVEKDVALKIIHRWRTWMKKQQPYDKQWKLTPYWQWKVRRLAKNISQVDWDDWVEPDRLEYLYFWYVEFGKDHCLVLEAHFKRKDKHFWLVGIILLFWMYLLYGQTCSMWTLVGLILI